jgi:Right handed beta helix region
VSAMSVTANPRARRLRFAVLLAFVALISLPAAVLGAGTSASFNGRSGSVSFARSGTRATVQIPDQPAGDVTVRLRLKTDTIPVGAGQTASVMMRRSGSAVDYRAQLQYDGGGALALSINRVVGGARVQLAATEHLSGVRWQPGRDLAVTFTVTGGSTTHVALKVWMLGTGVTEPSRAQLAATDKERATTTGAGRAALRFALPQHATRVPVRFDFSDVTLAATGATDTPPPPGPTPTPSPSASASPTHSPSATPTPTPTDSATPTLAPTDSATPTLAPTSEPTPTPPPEPTPTPSSPADGVLPTGAPLTSAPAVFVAPDGDDSGPGTLDQPWQTLQKAANSVPAGATVYLRSGTYGPFVMRRSGLAGQPTTFTAYPGETAIVDGSGAVPYTITLTAVHDVALTHLVVQGGYADLHEGGGVIIQASTNVTVSDSLLRDNKAFGVRSQKSTYVTIEDNEVTHNAVGVHIGELGEGTVVADNRIHDNDKMMVNTPDIQGDDVGAGGVALVHTVGHVVVRDNLVWGNRALSYDYGYDGSAFEIFAAQNWEFTDNTTWDNRVEFETGTDASRTPCSNGVFTRNTAYGPATVDVSRGIVLRCAENALIANNTFVGIQDFVFTLQHEVGTYGGSIEGLRILNNVMYLGDGAKAFSIDSAIPSSVVMDADLVYKTGSGYLATMVGKGATTSFATFAQWTGQEAHGIQANPDFVDMADHDYSLEPNSPAVDSALIIPGVTDGYSGAGPDRGSVESGL